MTSKRLLERKREREREREKERERERNDLTRAKAVNDKKLFRKLIFQLCCEQM